MMTVLQSSFYLSQSPMHTPQSIASVSQLWRHPGCAVSLARSQNHPCHTSHPHSQTPAPKSAKAVLALTRRNWKEA